MTVFRFWSTNAMNIFIFLSFVKVYYTADFETKKFRNYSIFINRVMIFNRDTKLVGIDCKVGE